MTSPHSEKTWIFTQFSSSWTTQWIYFLKENQMNYFVYVQSISVKSFWHKCPGDNHSPYEVLLENMAAHKWIARDNGVGGYKMMKYIRKIINDVMLCLLNHFTAACFQSWHWHPAFRLLPTPKMNTIKTARSTIVHSH